MPGTELFGSEERKEINDVLETGVLFRFNNDAQRNNIWKAREMEAEVCKVVGSKYAHAVSRDRKSTRLNSSHRNTSRMPSSA